MDLFRCDNMAVASQDQLLMHFLRCWSFYAACFRFQFYATQVPGVQNTAADALSRSNMLLFNSCTAGPTVLCSISNIGSTSPQQARLGFSSLDKLVQTLFDRGISPTTRAVYDSGWRQYIKFCNQYHITPLPASKESQTAFAAHLSQLVNPRIVQSYLCALRFFQIQAGLLQGFLLGSMTC